MMAIHVFDTEAQRHGEGTEVVYDTTQDVCRAS